MALTKVSYAMINGDPVNVLDFGAVGDGVADDTAAIQAAITGANGQSIFFPAGIYKVTNTLYPENDTKFIGEPGATGAFASFVSRISFDAPTVANTTLSAGINTTVTTIPLTNASAFPTSGIVYVQSVNGEYIKYTGKSGNNLTGCTRGYYGGTVGPAEVVPSGNGQTYSSGEPVWLLRPVMLLDNIFSGTIQNIEILNENFVSNTAGFDNLGVALYFTYSAYATVLRDSLIRGFEKAVYCGRAYVTTFEHPMIYNCAYGAQLDIANGAVFSDSDMGSIGKATAPTIDGWCYYLKGGNAALINGGNLGNGQYNIPIFADAMYAATANGIYVEAHAIDLVWAINNAVVYINNVYLKDTTAIGRTFTDGQIHINNISHQNTSINYIVNSDNTGSWSIKNKYNINTGLNESDQYGVGTARYEVPFFTQSTSPILATPQRGVKAVPDNTATGIFKIRSRADGSDTDVQVGLTVDYFVAGDFASGGAVSEKGIVEIAIHHRQTLAPVTALTVIGATQAIVVGSTRTVAFTASTTLITTNTYETTIFITSVSSNAAPSNITYVVTPSNYNLVSNSNQGLLTIL